MGKYHFRVLGYYCVLDIKRCFIRCEVKFIGFMVTLTFTNGPIPDIQGENTLYIAKKKPVIKYQLNM